MVKNLPNSAGDIRDVGLIPGLGRFPPWRKIWQPTPAFLPGVSHRKRRWKASVHRVANSQTSLK